MPSKKVRVQQKRSRFVLPAFLLFFAAVGTLLIIFTRAAEESSTIGYIGCSNSRDAVNGYHTVGGTRLWPAIGPYGGGVIKTWQDQIGDPHSEKWNAFNAEQAAHPAQIVWVSICAYSGHSEDDIYNATVDVINEVKRIIPGVTVYASPINDWVAPHVCSKTGKTAVPRTTSTADRVSSEGKAKRGPNVGSLLSINQVPSAGATAANSETVEDGCHPNEKGEAKLGASLKAFNFVNSGGTNPPPVSAACNDKKDNDSDTKIDLSDQGCSSVNDTSEANSNPPTSDTTAPSAPTNLRVLRRTNNSITLSWGASTDNVKVEGYYIYRGSTSTKFSSSSTTFTDTGLKAGKSYRYAVAAYDPDGNISSRTQIIVQTYK